MPPSAPSWPAPLKPWFERTLLRARRSPTLARLGPGAPWRVEVSFVGSARMRELNARYRGKRYATDILSFEAPKPFRAAGLLGELVICAPTLRAQAREQGHPVRKELEILLVHGLLHLLGMDHERGGAEAARMARWEKRLGGSLIDRALMG
jgi:probable rRNA maturation factor